MAGITVGGRKLWRPEEAKRGGNSAREYVAQGKVGLSLTDAIALAQILDLNNHIAHQLDHVGNGAFHPSEKGQAAHQHNHDGPR